MEIDTFFKLHSSEIYFEMSNQFDLTTGQPQMIFFFFEFENLNLYCVYYFVLFGALWKLQVLLTLFIKQHVLIYPQYSKLLCEFQNYFVFGFIRLLYYSKWKRRLGTSPCFRNELQSLSKHSTTQVWDK